MVKRNYKDLTGQVFGNWTVVSFSHSNSERKYFWQCRCVCGTIKNIAGHHLKSGASRSCGCLLVAWCKENKKVHGKSGTKIYRTWTNMLNRVLNPKSKRYKDYGGRGITVSESWLCFDTFYRDMGEVPSGKSLDRVDNNRGYCKENCRWATRKEQNNNRRDNIFIRTSLGSVSIKELSEETGISRRIMAQRFRRYGLVVNRRNLQDND